MARRQLKPRPNPAYEFSSMEECEESPKYGGLHRIEPSQWPPKAQHGEARPTLAARCTRCGCNCIVSGDNDPDVSGIEVVLPEKKVKEPVPA